MHETLTLAYARILSATYFFSLTNFVVQINFRSRKFGTKIKCYLGQPKINNIREVIYLLSISSLLKSACNKSEKNHEKLIPLTGNSKVSENTNETLVLKYGKVKI